MLAKPSHSKIYRGRFAPSPTGPLHLGSLLAATGSYLQAKSQSGEWLLRIEDIDPPREQAGASESILHTLEAFGFEWDEEVVFQHRRYNFYEEAIDFLLQQHLAYFCQCSRKQIAAIARSGINGPIYPRTCLTQHRHLESGAIRFITDEQEIGFDDKLQGTITQSVSRDSGDFVLKRADGLYAYQLAVVIDDAEQKITEVVRGSDLIDLTPGQINLQKRLNLSMPDYVHLPVINNVQGQKLSKQTGAPAINIEHSSALLWQCLDILGQQPPVQLSKESNETIWQWAISHWQLENVPRQRSVTQQD